MNTDVDVNDRQLSFERYVLRKWKPTTGCNRFSIRALRMSKDIVYFCIMYFFNKSFMFIFAESSQIDFNLKVTDMTFEIRLKISPSC